MTARNPFLSFKPKTRAEINRFVILLQLFQWLCHYQILSDWHLT